MDPYLANQIHELEKIPLHNRAQEIRNELFSKKSNNKLRNGGYKKNDRSISSKSIS